MAMTQKLAAGSSFPVMTWPTADGGKVDVAGASGWGRISSGLRW